MLLKICKGDFDTDSKNDNDSSTSSREAGDKQWVASVAQM